MTFKTEIARPAMRVLPLLVVAACTAAAPRNSEPAASSAPPAGGSAPASGGATSGGTASAPADSVQERVEKVRSDLERSLIAGPSVTDALGYRTLWQARVDLDPRAKLVDGNLSNDVMLVWDSAGIVSRLRPSNGDTMWQAAPSSPVERILTATIVPAGRTEFGAILTDTRCFIVDASNGHFQVRQDFKRLANTGAVLQPPYLVYGTRDGQVVWHDYVVGFDHRTGQLDGQVVAMPRLVGTRIIASSTGGSVAAFGAQSARLLWERRLNGAVSARPEATEEAVWVPCQDQYLWCLAARDGRTLWRYFTQAPLEADPVLVGDGLYMQLPGEGLVAFEPLPQDKLDGVVRWRSPEAVGTVLGLCRAGLLAWDGASRTLTILEKDSGSIVRTIKIPGARALRAISPIDGDLMLLGDDGRVQRLTPIAKRDPSKA